jgi:hypothetical protein
MKTMSEWKWIADYVAIAGNGTNGAPEMQRTSQRGQSRNEIAKQTVAVAMKSLRQTMANDLTDVVQFDRRLGSTMPLITGSVSHMLEDVQLALEVNGDTSVVSKHFRNVSKIALKAHVSRPHADFCWSLMANGIAETLVWVLQHLETYGSFGNKSTFLHQYGSALADTVFAAADLAKLDDQMRALLAQAGVLEAAVAAAALFRLDATAPQAATDTMHSKGCLDSTKTFDDATPTATPSGAPDSRPFSPASADWEPDSPSWPGSPSAATVWSVSTATSPNRTLQDFDDSLERSEDSVRKKLIDA